MDATTVLLLIAVVWLSGVALVLAMARAAGQADALEARARAERRRPRGHLAR